MSAPNLYDGGSIEIGPSNTDSVIHQIGEDGEFSEYVYVRYRIANKKILAMENQLLYHEITIDKYAQELQTESQLREIYQKELFKEQTRHAACRTAYARLLKHSNSHQTCEVKASRTYQAQNSQLLTLVAHLQEKIRVMVDKHSSALFVAADRIARTEDALDRLHLQVSEAKDSASDVGLDNERISS